MPAITRSACILLLLALAAVGASWHYWIQSMASMRAESALAHAQLEATLQECQAAVTAANHALKARQIIYEQTEAKLQRLAACLGDADSIALPDSLRSFFQSYPSCPVPAAGPAPGADSAATPQ